MLADDLFFTDTNILLYSTDATDPFKQETARRWLELLWDRGSGRISWQVLHEFYSNAVKKFRTPSPKAREVVETFMLWKPVDTSPELIRRAWHWTDTARLSYWDGLIVGAAEYGGCRWLLSEDMQTGRKLGEVTIVNPFKAKPQDFGLLSNRKTQ
jgi:predicted nucleic acid-binding protein